MLKIYLYLALLLLLFPKSAHAYLDPGTGSYLIQVFVATFFGSLFFAKSIFRKVSDIVNRYRSKETSFPETETSDEE